MTSPKLNDEMIETSESSASRLAIPPPKRRGASRVLSSYVDETLSIYRPQWIGLRDVAWEGDRLTSQIAQCTTPFTRGSTIDYLTASMAVLYVSQMSYVAARLLIEDGVAPAELGLTTTHFFKCRDDGSLVTTALQTRFRKKLQVTDEPLPASQSLENAFVLGNHIFAAFCFSLADKSVTGTIRLAMPCPVRDD